MVSVKQWHDKLKKGSYEKPHSSVTVQQTDYFLNYNSSSQLDVILPCQDYFFVPISYGYYRSKKKITEVLAIDPKCCFFFGTAHGKF